MSRPPLTSLDPQTYFVTPTVNWLFHWQNTWHEKFLYKEIRSVIGVLRHSYPQIKFELLQLQLSPAIKMVSVYQSFSILDLGLDRLRSGYIKNSGVRSLGVSRVDYPKTGEKWRGWKRSRRTDLDLGPFRGNRLRRTLGSGVMGLTNDLPYQS